MTMTARERKAGLTLSLVRYRLRNALAEVHAELDTLDMLDVLPPGWASELSSALAGLEAEYIANLLGEGGPFDPSVTDWRGRT